ncbi:MAG TPA: rod shape-determining protein MreC [Hyphomicrobiaceae bacterium]|nr:rod shape-determining protein MreC [Hyphomicrobiaceae bacterium]
MSSLAKDRFARRAVQDKPRSARTSVMVFMLVAAALLASSQIDHPLLAAARRHASDLLTPALTAANALTEPVRALGRQLRSHSSLVAEVERLKGEVQRLSAWEARAKELERRIGHLTALARVVDEPAVGFVTVRVIVEARSPFVRTALVGAGRNHGLRPGYPVINGDGLVGRIVDAGDRSARLLLLSDPASRIPVIVGAASVDAILLGGGGSSARLTLFANGAKVSDGDEVVTSGVGGLFPRGLRIGVARQVAADLTVELYAHLDQLDYVSVLQFQSPLLDIIDRDRVAASALPRNFASGAVGGPGAEPGK